jgi:hypothetical protein
MTTLTLQAYKAKALRGTRGLIYIRSRDGYFGLFRPSPDIVPSPTAEAILRWALRHPNTRDATGFLRLDRDTFAHLNGQGDATLYTRVPDRLA